MFHVPASLGLGLCPPGCDGPGGYQKDSKCESGGKGEWAGLDTCHQPLLVKVILRGSNRDLNSGDTDLKASCPLYNPKLPDLKFLTR